MTVKKLRVVKKIAKKDDIMQGQRGIPPISSQPPLSQVTTFPPKQAENHVDTPNNVHVDTPLPPKVNAITQTGVEEDEDFDENDDDADSGELSKGSGEKEIDEDDYDEDADTEEDNEEIEERPQPQVFNIPNLKRFPEPEIRKFIYDMYEQYPEIRADQLQAELDRLRIVDTHGQRVGITTIMAYKRAWSQWVENREDEVERVSRLREQEEDIGVEPMIPENTGNGVQYIERPRADKRRKVFHQQPNAAVNNEPPNQNYAPVYAQPPVVFANAGGIAGSPITTPTQTPQYQPQPQPSQAPLIIPPRKSRLEFLFEQLQTAVASKNVNLVAVVVDGIYKEYDRAEGGGGAETHLWGLMNTMMTGMFNKQMSSSESPTKLLKDIVAISQGLIPPPQPPQQAAGESENVQMAKAVGTIAQQMTGEIKDTILTVAGKKGGGGGGAEDKGVCPYCEKVIPIDSSMCPYCGGKLAPPEPAQGMYRQMPQQQQPPQLPQSNYGYNPNSVPAMQSHYQMAQQPQMQQPQMPPQMPQQMPPQQVPNQAQGGEGITPKETEELKGYVKKVANAISNKDNPAQTINFIWRFVGETVRKQLLLGAIIGEVNLYAVLEKMSPQYPDMAQQLSIISSPEGRNWVYSALETVKENARKDGLKVTEAELALMARELQQKVGFEIPGGK